MPLFYQHNINEFTKLAVWHITEDEPFFLEKVSIQQIVMHPHKRLQHLAGRFLLEYLYPGFPFHLIEIADSKKPLLGNGQLHFSISHCGDYAGAIISKKNIVGIDVELVTPKIEWVKDKFLTEKEISLIENYHQLSSVYQQLLTLFWSSKESVYKWYGKGRASFKNNIFLEKLFFENNEGFINGRFKKEKETALKIEFRFFEKLCLAWVVE